MINFINLQMYIIKIGFFARVWKDASGRSPPFCYHGAGSEDSAMGEDHSGETKLPKTSGINHTNTG